MEDTKERPVEKASDAQKRIAELEAGLAGQRELIETLRGSEQRYRRFTQIVTDYIYTVYIENGKPAKTVHEPACVSVTGYTSEEFERDPYLWINMVHETDREGVRKHVERLLNGQGRAPIEHRIVTKSGTTRWVRNTPVPHYDEAGNIQFYDGLISDITGRKTAETEIRALNSELELRVAVRTAQLEGSNRKLREEISERMRVEREILEARKTLQILIDTMPSGVLLCDSTGRVSIANAAASAILGGESANMAVGPHGGCSLHHPDGTTFLPEELPLLRTIAYGETITNLEVRVRRGNGEEFPIVVSASPVRDGVNGITGAVVVLHDITGIKKAEEDLRRSQERYRELFEHSPIPIWEEDFSLISIYFDQLRQRGIQDIGSFLKAEHDEVAHLASLIKIRDVNETSVEFFGATSKEGINTGLLSYFDEASLDIFTEELIALAGGNTTFNCEIPIKIPAGDKRILSLFLYVVPGFERTLSRVLVSFIDITERKEAEEALKQSEMIFRQIAENSQEIYWLMDADFSRLLYVSPAYETIWQRSTASVYEKFISWLEAVHPDDAGRIREALKKNTGDGFDEEFRIIRPDGSIRWVWARSFLIKNKSGETERILGVVRDITERKFLEEELFTVQKISSIGVLAGGIAHDFNNLLTVILGNISLAKKHIAPESEAFSRLNDSEKACDIASELSYRLLTFARGGIPVKKTINIRTLLMEAVSFSLSGSGIKPEYDIPEDLHPAVIDENQVRQVFYNIAINAKEAMPAGGILNVSAGDISLPDGAQLPLEPGNYIFISFRDHGVGIPPGHLSRIFDPYFTSSGLGNIKGKGLGLAICHSIIKKHSGHITVESKIGMGTTFTIYLPAATLPPPEHPENLSAESGTVP